MWPTILRGCCDRARPRNGSNNLEYLKLVLPNHKLESVLIICGLEYFEIRVEKPTIRKKQAIKHLRLTPDYSSKFKRRMEYVEEKASLLQGALHKCYQISIDADTSAECCALESLTGSMLLLTLSTSGSPMIV